MNNSDMVPLLLLLLLGSICAQKPEDSPLNDDDDNNNLSDLNHHEDEDDMDEDLDTEGFDEFDLEAESGKLPYNDTDELEDSDSEDDEDGMFDDLETNPDEPELKTQPDGSMAIEDRRNRRHRRGRGRGILRIVTRIARSFFRAENFCRKRRGDLSSVHGRRTNGKIGRLLKKTKSKLAWIGVWRPFRNGKYENVDHSPMNYKHFQRGQCKKGARRCVAMNTRTGRWSCQNCKRKLPFVCKCRKRP